MADKFYAWSNISNGGDVMIVTDPLGRERKVVSERNVIPAGDEVSQGDLDASDEQWAEWVDGGVVRSYPFPDIPAGSTDSPVVHLQKQIAQAAESEEERMVAAVTGTSPEHVLVEEAQSLPVKEEDKEAEAPKATAKK